MYLHFVAHLAVNRKRMLRLMREHHLGVRPNLKLKAKRTPNKSNPKGNADPERVMRTLQEECLWLHEWTSPVELVRGLEAWVDYENEHYLHSALGDKTPRQCEQEYHPSRSTPFVAA